LREEEIRLSMANAAIDIPRRHQIENVLDDAGLLVIGFLDEERIVLNAGFFVLFLSKDANWHCQ
jgi:hypothetical protein